MREPDVVVELEMMLKVGILGDDLGHVEQEPRPVKGHHLEDRAVLATRGTVPLDVDDALAQAVRERDRVEQSSRWIETPRPWVMKPMIGSPGTGEQHRAKWIMTSSSPST